MSSSDRDTLERCLRFLEQHPAVRAKETIGEAYAPAQALAGEVAVGDDCAVLPDGDGYLLFAAEGMLASFVAEDPWFAGYSAVMVNGSDVAAMGGRPLAVVDVLWAPDAERSAELWAGMTAASRAYGVPIVGGHTTFTGTGGAYLAAAVLGRARALLTSFDAQPGDNLLFAVDLRGSYRGDKPFWNASVGSPPERLRADLELLPTLAEAGWCRAGKDVSNGGVVGTLLMLLNCSGVGAGLCLDRLPRPVGVDLERWLVSFPSFGYLLSVRPEHTRKVCERFRNRDLLCEPVGQITAELGFTLAFGSARMPFGLV